MDKKGAVFITVLIISMLMVFIAISASNMLLQDAHMIRHLKHSTQAQYLAEAGISDALVTLGTSVSAITFSGSLAGGTYSGNVTKIGTRYLITSVGTFKGVSRTAAMEVKTSYPEAMNNTLAASNDIEIKSVQGNVTIKGDLHANNDIKLIEQGPSTLIHVQAYGSFTGKVTCVNTLDKDGNVDIDDWANSGGGKPELPFPSYDFAHIKSVAQSGGLYYNSNTNFTDGNPSLDGGTAGITYVDGIAKFSGTNTITGGFVAANDIKLEKPDKLTQQHDAGNRFPIFMCNNSMKLYGEFNTVEKNLVYAANDIKIETTGGTATVLGCVLAGNTVKVVANNDVTLTYGQISGTEIIPGEDIEIVSWNR